MKIDYTDKKIIVFLKKEQTNNINFKEIEELESYFRKLFIKIKKRIEIELNGFYQIDIYLDKIYGAIIEIEKQDFDYIEYDDNQIDMRIIIHEIKILYKVNDIFEIKKENVHNIYKYKNNYYIDINNNISKKQLLPFLEISQLVYKTDDIIDYGKKI